MPPTLLDCTLYAYIPYSFSLFVHPIFSFILCSVFFLCILLVFINYCIFFSLWFIILSFCMHLQIIFLRFSVHMYCLSLVLVFLHYISYLPFCISLLNTSGISFYHFTTSFLSPCTVYPFGIFWFICVLHFSHLSYFCVFFSFLKICIIT